MKLMRNVYQEERPDKGQLFRDKGRTGKPAGKPENGDVSALTGK